MPWLDHENKILKSLRPLSSDCSGCWREWSNTSATYDGGSERIQNRSPLPLSRQGNVP